MKKIYKLLTIGMAGLTIPTTAFVGSCSKQDKGPISQEDANKAFYYFANNETNHNFTIDFDFTLAENRGSLVPQIVGEGKILAITTDQRHDTELNTTFYSTSPRGPAQFKNIDSIVTRHDNAFYQLKKERSHSESPKKYHIDDILPNNYNTLEPFLSGSSLHIGDFFRMWPNLFYIPSYLCPILFCTFEWDSSTKLYQFKITDDEDLFLNITFAFGDTKKVTGFNVELYTSGAAGIMPEIYAKAESTITYDNAEINIPEFNNEGIEKYDEMVTNVKDLTKTYSIRDRWPYQHIIIKPTENVNEFNAVTGNSSWLNCDGYYEIYKDNKLLTETSLWVGEGDYYIADRDRETSSIVFNEPFDPNSTYYILISPLGDCTIKFEKK